MGPDTAQTHTQTPLLHISMMGPLLGSIHPLISYSRGQQTVMHSLEGLVGFGWVHHGVNGRPSSSHTDAALPPRPSPRSHSPPEIL